MGRLLRMHRVLTAGAITVLLLIAASTVFAANEPKATFTNMTIEPDCSAGSYHVILSGDPGSYSMTVHVELVTAGRHSVTDGTFNSPSQPLNGSVNVAFSSLTPKGGACHLIAYYTVDNEYRYFVNIQCSNGNCVPGGFQGGEIVGYPGLWLAELCEPNTGFSAAGWMTFGSDVEHYSIFASHSPNGPWTPTTLKSPVSKPQLNAVVTQVAAANYSDLWLKAQDSGKPMKLGDAISARDTRMNALCGFDQ